MYGNVYQDGKDSYNWGAIPYFDTGRSSCFGQWRVRALSVNEGKV